MRSKAAKKALNELKRRFIMSDSAEFGAKVGHRTQGALKFSEFLYRNAWKSSILFLRRRILGFQHQKNCVDGKDCEQPKHKVHTELTTHCYQVSGHQTQT